MSRKVEKQWQAAMGAEPQLMKDERRRLETRPLDRSDNPRRTGPLKGPLATKSIGGEQLPQWQREISGAGRVWYAPDPETRSVWITAVSFKHPKATS